MHTAQDTHYMMHTHSHMQDLREVSQLMLGAVIVAVCHLLLTGKQLQLGVNQSNELLNLSDQHPPTESKTTSNKLNLLDQHTPIESKIRAMNSSTFRPNTHPQKVITAMNSTFQINTHTESKTARAMNSSTFRINTQPHRK